jgi:hypothetical protein
MAARLLNPCATSIDHRIGLSGGGSLSGKDGNDAQQRRVPSSLKGLGIRIAAAGIDTWSPCWYVEPGSRLASTMRSMATRPVSRSWQLPDPIAGHRVGWFADSGLIFAEGRARRGGLCAASQISDALATLRAALEESGIAPVPSSELRLRLRRLDVAVDLRFATSVDGLSILAQAAAVGGGKVGVYRDEHCVETVVLMTPSGKTKARVYDKGRETGSAPRGRWLRFEAQWPFHRGCRPLPGELGPEDLRERVASRFTRFWQPSRSPRPGITLLARRLAGAIEEGELLPSRARSLAGYLFLAAAGLPQGARRTASELERECRELGLSLSGPGAESAELDLAVVIDWCLRPEAWALDN